MSKRKPEKMKQTKEEDNSDWFYGFGYNQCKKEYDEWLESKLGDELWEVIQWSGVDHKSGVESGKLKPMKNKEDEYVNYIAKAIRKHLGVKDE